jgi:hypothetical protein
MGLKRLMSEAEINEPLPVLVLDTIFVEVLSAQDKYPLDAHSVRWIHQDAGKVQARSAARL